MASYHADIKNDWIPWKPRTWHTYCVDDVHFELPKDHSAIIQLAYQWDLEISNGTDPLEDLLVVSTCLEFLLC